MISRKRGKRESPFLVLIVCEGKNTEPAYFYKFREFLNSKYSDYYKDGIIFNIFPLPPQEVELIDQEEQLFVRKRSRRKLKEIDQVINEDLEEGFRAAPIRWVRYAQKQSQDVSFNQVWSVFDYDNRDEALIQSAFELAKNTNNGEFSEVKIAYSSYSFEYWVLLHYELLTNYHNASLCRDEHKNEFGCGTNSQIEGDCEGRLCLIGHMRKMNYPVANIVKSRESIFPQLSSRILVACKRSRLIRKMNGIDEDNLVAMKPVTTMDLFCKDLIPDFEAFKWYTSEGGFIEFEGGELHWSLSEIDISVSVVSFGTNTIILPVGCIHVLDVNFEAVPINERMLIRDKGEFDVANIAFDAIQFAPSFISIKLNDLVHYSQIQT